MPSAAGRPELQPYLESLFAASTTGVGFYDKDLRCVAVNARLASYVDLRPEDLVAHRDATPPPRPR